MKQSKDPFAVAFEAEESPPESPIGPDDSEAQTLAAGNDQRDEAGTSLHQSNRSTAIRTTRPIGKAKDDDEEEEEENMDIELSKLPGGDPEKIAKMQSILSRFTEEQMNRYESFRRSGFQRSNMKRLLSSITGSSKVSVPMTIVASGIAKMFVGELVETARLVMTERKDRGPIRPCHIREAYRRLKLEGKVPRRSVPRLFH